MKMLKGKYNQAMIYASIIDETTNQQILTFLNQKFVKNSKIRIMADCHAGAGCVIGTTMTIHQAICPSLVGVDIGCGMLTVELKDMDIDLIKLDRFIRKKIPSGFDSYKDNQIVNAKISNLKCYQQLKSNLFYKSMGTLGGGNHFIEIDQDEEHNKYLIIHTGSRNLGKSVADYYQKQAIALYDKDYHQRVVSLVKRYKQKQQEEKIEKAIASLHKKYYEQNYEKDLTFLHGKLKNDYLHDISIVQDYAKENREKIAMKILNFLNCNLNDFFYFHTIHNYISTKDNILRKGAISAYQDEMVLIPLNMKDGSILAKGKSNQEYNFSAPHGAGRILNRREAKEKIKLEDFKEAMKGIYSTSIQEDTLDESPFAYKSKEDILPNIMDTVDILKIIRPIYNFKATQQRKR